MAKKNNTMRGAVLMLALTIITSCFVGGTLSKYTTSGGFADTARVAKWGVEIQAIGDTAFSYKYTGTGDAITVRANDYVPEDPDTSAPELPGSNLVAPGTSSEDISKSVIFAVTGTPEVKTQLTPTFDDATRKDVSLTYKVYDDGAGDYGAAQTYNPVKYTLSIYKPGTEIADPEGVGWPESTEGKFTVTSDLTLEQLATAIKTHYAKKTYDPNTIIDNMIKIDWEWDFEKAGDGVTANDIALQDAMDTFLGDVIAQGLDNTATREVEIAGTTYQFSAPETSINYALDLTLTQVD